MCVFKIVGVVLVIEFNNLLLGEQVEFGLLFVVYLDVCWCDLDVFNYVNNFIYFIYFEEVWLQWLCYVFGLWFDELLMLVLVVSNFNYCQFIVWLGYLVVELFCECLGNSLIILVYCIVDVEYVDQFYCDGQVVLVWMNFVIGKLVLLLQVICDLVVDGV